MDLLSLVVLLIAITLIVVSVYTMTVCAELKKTLLATQELIRRIDSEVIPVAADLKDVLSDLKVTTEAVASRSEDVKSAMEAVGDTGRNISRINVAIGHTADFLSNITLLSTGVKAAGQYAYNRILRKRG